MSLQSFLAKHFTRPITPAELEELRARAWLDQGVVVLAPAEITDDWLKARLVQEATKRFGRRMKR